MSWLRRNTEALQGAAALVMAVTAVVAVIAVPWQLRQADRIQRDQTAREIYREFLNLTVQKPEIAVLDYCALTDDKQRIAYSAYVEYLLYTADQMISTSKAWKEPMKDYLSQHMSYLCSFGVWEAQSPEVQGLAEELGLHCEAAHLCN